MMTLRTIMDRSKNSSRQHKSNRCVQKFSNYWGEKQERVGAGTALPSIKVRSQTDRLCEKSTKVSSPRKRGSIPCEHKLDSPESSIYDSTNRRFVGSLRPTFLGMTKPEEWFLHSLSVWEREEKWISAYPLPFQGRLTCPPCFFFWRRVGSFLSIPDQVFPYRIPRFFFSIRTSASTEAAQSGQTYRFVVSLKSGSWVWWQLGHFIISGLSSRGLDIH